MFKNLGADVGARQSFSILAIKDPFSSSSLADDEMRFLKTFLIKIMVHSYTFRLALLCLTFTLLILKFGYVAVGNLNRNHVCLFCFSY